MRYSFSDLVRIMADLRDPERGCPWDLEQNFSSIAPYTIEEAYEVAEAIQTGDMQNLCEELGDLLLQPIYHAQMASESGHFTIEDVVHAIAAKMIARHPHVFGSKTAQSASDVNAIWEEQKSAEGKGSSASVLDDVPKALPALLRAQKLQKRAGKKGFEWREAAPILDKLDEELGELRAAMARGSAEEQMEELGDVLFVLANFARLSGINAEEALRLTNAKFERRCRAIEAGFVAQGKEMKSLPLDELQGAWDAQKRAEKKTASG